MTLLLRIVAIAIALAALVDPAISFDRKHPVTIDLRAAPSRSDPDGIRAERIKAELAARLGNAVRLSNEKPGSAVIIGGVDGALPDGVPVSTVAVTPAGRNLAIIDARARGPIVPGQRASVDVRLAATDADGANAIVTLERDGLEVARASWTAGPRGGRVALTYAPSGPGPAALRVRVAPVGGEATLEDNVADVGVSIVTRPLRVLTWEARPSWSVAFVRRALEADPVFETSSLVRNSRGLETATGTPPASLDAPALARFDVVVAGAPEELGRAEVAALDVFARERGGIVLLLPDRAPEGPYRTLLPASRFDEVLLQRGASLTADGARAITASEFALPRDEAGQPIATLEHQGTRAAITAWPRGNGLVVFSGALDAWRFRDADGDRYATFWTALVASLALQAPQPLAVDVQPLVAAPGDPVTIRARSSASGSAHSASATLVDAKGRAVPARLWPTAVAGEFEGTLDAPATGRYDVRVTGDAGLVSDAVLIVKAGARARHAAEAPPWIAAATGGVAADAGDLASVEKFIKAMPQPVERSQLFPMRSPWWIVPFTLALCAEWALRRRKGLR